MSHPLDSAALYHCECGEWHYKYECYAPPCKREVPVFIPKDATFVPGPKRVFVFGSNVEGIHGAGAALTAYKMYGAVWGKGEGFYPNKDNPQSYGLPTCEKARTVIHPLSFSRVKEHVEIFIQVSWERNDLTFFVTRIGCGLAGFTDYDIAPLFKDAPPNCELPPGWENFEEIYGTKKPQT